jgi:hypothetical protein
LSPQNLRLRQNAPEVQITASICLNRDIGRVHLDKSAKNRNLPQECNDFRIRSEGVGKKIMTSGIGFAGMPSWLKGKLKLKKIKGLRKNP